MCVCGGVFNLSVESFNHSVYMGAVWIWVLILVKMSFLMYMVHFYFYSSHTIVTMKVSEIVINILYGAI